MGLALALPLLVVVLGVYNFIAFTNIGSLEVAALHFSLLSGATVSITWGQLIILAALMLLFVEVLKSARASNTAIVDHILSTLVFIAALIEFMVVREAGTPTFLVLVVICLIDVVAGYTVSIRHARRDFALGGRYDH
ncbi:MAG: hypothetical protein AB7S41_07425 [Parvibaculaceae bacterium]